MALLCALALPAAAQETTGTIQGAVTDQTGAVLPGVTVAVKHTQTGRTQEVVSGETGRYSVSLLQPGTYEVTFTLAGFQSTTVRGIELHVNDRLDINGRLGVGVSETVEVSAASQFVQPTPAVQNLMSSRQVQELPLNNRNFVQLATLVPGVSSDLGDEVGVGLTSIVSISINGGRRNAVNWLVDGVSNVDVGSNITLLSTPTVESIQEFKIITSSYAAEWPRSGGGIINIVTKGGTQKFSGTAYEFFRNDKLNANSFFRNLSSNPDLNSAPPRLRYNNFGYTVGGPLLPSREKAFFFWSQEWRRISRVPFSTNATVPLPEFLTDPTNANYVAPADRDPLAVRLLEGFPAPNVAGTNRYINTEPNINNTRQEVVRVDYDVSANWKLTGRYTHDLSETREPGGLFFGAVLPNIATTDTRVPGNVMALEARTIVGQGLNELKYQLSGNKIDNSTPEGTRNTRDQFGVDIPELFPENNASRIPSVSITGLSLLGATQGFHNVYWNHTLADNFTLQRDNHTYKAGLLMAFEQKNEGANAETQGRFTYVAGGGRTAFQNFLTGNRDGACTACSYSESQTDVTNNLRFNRYEMYVQDTWRARSNVTLDYGLRYVLYPPATDTNNVLTNFDPALYDPAQAPTFANAAGTLLVAGSGNPLNGIVVAGQNSPFGDGISKYHKDSIMPRAGVSWDPLSDGMTIVRAGWGLYYDQPLVGIFLQNTQVNPPFNNTVSVLNPTLSNPTAGISPTTTGLRALFATATPFETPKTQQWNIGVQRQIYSRGFIDVGYVGSRGDDLIRPNDINQPQPADVVAENGNINLARPFAGYTGIRFHETTARSRYWGLLTQFRHEAGAAGSLTLNYTLSRNQTDASNDRDAVDLPQNPLDLEAEYADARTDRRHIFSATYIYELPFFRDSENLFLRAALGGWQVSGITNISSGAPIARITASTNGGRRGNRANQVGDPNPGEQTGLYWFDPAAFAPPADGTYGNSRRAPFVGPGRNQTDLALSKNFVPFGKRVQFRADFINAFNHTQFTTVDGACAVSLTTCVVPGDTFGQILASRAPREVQLSLKLYW
jgi:hypothetical protein